MGSLIIIVSLHVWCHSMSVLLSQEAFLSGRHAPVTWHHLVTFASSACYLEQMHATFASFYMTCVVCQGDLHHVKDANNKII